MVEVENSIQKYPAYKDSGVEWMGEIPEHWRLQKFKSFLTVHGRIGFRGYTVNDLVSKGEGAITISPSNMGESKMVWDKVSYLSWKKYYESPEIMVDEGDLLIVKTASIGKIAYVKELKEKATINPQILILKNIKIDRDYFYYQLVSNVIQCQLETQKIGSTIYTISENKILNFNAIIPSKLEQTAIAQFLDDKTTKIDDAITIKEQQINLLKERKQILIHKAVTQGLNPNVSLKDSGVEWIGEIPEHWEVKNLRYVFEFLNNKRIPLSAIVREKRQGNYPYYGASGIIDFVDNYIFDEKLILIGEDGANLLSKSTPLAFIAEGKYWVNNHAHILRPLFKGFSYWAEQLSLIDYTIFISGAAQPKLSRGNLGSVKVIVPSQNDLKEISIYIDSISEKLKIAISLKHQEIAKLKEYKSSLINSVVTGKVKVC